MSLITISSGLGCKALDISKIISGELKLNLYDEKRIEREAKKLNKDKEDIHLIQEKAPSLMKLILLDEPGFYYNFTESVIYGIAQRGSGIIMGYAGQILLKNVNCALKVRLYAPFESRVKNVIKEYRVSEQEAKKMIKDRDNNQKNFFKYIFNSDYESPELYDLVINTDKIDTKLAAEIIIETIKSNKIKECSTSTLSDIKRLSLQKRINYELAKNSINTKELKIDVKKNGVVEFNGFMQTLKEIEKLKEVAKKIDGISEVKLDVREFTQFYSI